MKSLLFKIRKFPLLSETFIVNQIIIAIEQGFQVTIITDELVDAKESKQQKNLDKYRILENVKLIDHKIPGKRIGRFMGAVRITLSNLIRLKSLYSYFRLKNNLSSFFEYHFYQKFSSFDLVHIQYGTNAKPIDDLKLSGAFNMPVILTFHGHDAFFPINGIIKEEGYYKKIFEVADVITANTRYLKSQLIKIKCPESKIRIIPVPVDIEFFYFKKKEPLLKNRKIKLLSVGRLEKIKGHDLGIKAVKFLKDKGYHVDYEIIGQGQYQKKLEAQIKELGMNDYVKLVGPKSPEELREYYWESDIFLMTSRPVFENIRETQGLVTLESQSCGLPVVAFDTGGVKYTLKENETGLLARENDVNHFSKQIEKLILSADLYAKMSLEGTKFVREYFSKEIISKEWSEIYNLNEF